MPFLKKVFLTSMRQRTEQPPADRLKPLAQCPKALSSLMPSSRDLPSLLSAVLKISEQGQSKIEGGILMLLPIFLLLVFFNSFVLPFFVQIFVQIDNFDNYLAI